MRYDPQLRAYTDNNIPVDSATVRNHIEDYIDSEKDEVEREANRVLTGAITLASFFTFLRGKIHNWHSNAATVAYGGESRMSTERWLRVNDLIETQLDYLDKWQVAAEQGERLTASLVSKVAGNDAIPAGLDIVVRREVEAALMTSDAATRGAAVREAVVTATADSVGEEVAAVIASEAVTVTEAADLPWASLASRGRMYPDATFATFENSVRQRETDAGAVGVRRVCFEDPASCEDCPALATEEYVSLSDIADIGDAQCLTNCRCYYEFQYLGVDPLEIDREIYA